MYQFKTNTTAVIMSDELTWTGDFPGDFPERLSEEQSWHNMLAELSAYGCLANDAKDGDFYLTHYFNENPGLRPSRVVLSDIVKWLLQRQGKDESNTGAALHALKTIRYGWLVADKTVFFLKRYVLHLKLHGLIDPKIKRSQTLAVAVPGRKSSVTLRMKGRTPHPEVLMDFSGLVPPTPWVLCAVLRGFLACCGFVTYNRDSHQISGARLNIEVTYMPVFPTADSPDVKPQFGDTVNFSYEPINGNFDWLRIQDYLGLCQEQHLATMVYRPQPSYHKTELRLSEGPSDLPYLNSCPCGSQPNCPTGVNFLNTDICPCVPKEYVN